MFVIKAEALLAILLSKRQNVTFPQLRMLKDMESANPDICLDVSASSIGLAIYYSPHLFSLYLGQPWCVTRTQGSDYLFNSSDSIENLFFKDIPKRIRLKIEQAFQAIENIG